MRLCVERLRASALRAHLSSQHGHRYHGCNSSLRVVKTFTGGDRSCIRHSTTTSTPISTLHEFRPNDEISRQPLSRPIAELRPSEKSLPLSCPGCGALSQEVDSREAGFYSRSRKAVKLYIKSLSQSVTDLVRPSIPESKGGNEDLAAEKTQRLGLGLSLSASQPSIPICDRCHDLVYNSKGQSIAHPSVEDLADSIAESPFKRNHVYHVLDAADFPMSLFSKVFQSLELAKPRSQNRRARYKITTKPSVSFIITRSDLLGPTKEMVDRMMPYFQGVLRKALGGIGSNMRMSNVHLVSAKRGWWTKAIKDDIWKRGGGNWMVGRVNVGKSNLFEVLFPKGSGERAPVYAEVQDAQHRKSELQKPEVREDFMQEDSMLPPPQPEVPFPTMPIVSSLPGTTASPIRLPFGNGRGELVDLPGLERGDLEKWVRPDSKLDLVMEHRPNVRQHIIKPGQSLLLGGGLIRITPQLDMDDGSVTMMAYPFLPIDAHVTSTEKAIGTQLQERDSGIESVLADDAGQHISSAGLRRLTTNVTKIRAGPLLRAGVNISKLAFRVYSTDIVIEGVGWVELVCQVRRKRKEAHQSTGGVVSRSPGDPLDISKDFEALKQEGNFTPYSTLDQAKRVSQQSRYGDDDPHFPYPKVEIFSPQGKHIGQREPLGAWILWDDGRKRKSATSATARQRKPMAGAKRRAKLDHTM